ncbi:MAG: hypothetical protein A2W91_04290 [Bacteroidetes bacterium GWF2_38_335]|nr:MAG: hypothetical protein A2W91_04290 [Bacteroidetes bacterium GWF2_38_335]HBS88273.1 hypothetical protein [Bacteroidales bacterium]
MKKLSIFLLVIISLIAVDNLKAQLNLEDSYDPNYSFSYTRLTHENIKTENILQVSTFALTGDGFHSFNGSLEFGKGYFSFSPPLLLGAPLMIIMLFAEDGITFSGILVASTLDSYSFRHKITKHIAISGNIKPIHLTSFRHTNGEFKYLKSSGSLSFSLDYFWRSKKLNYEYKHNTNGLSIFAGYKVLYNHWDDGYNLGVSFHY